MFPEWRPAESPTTEAVPGTARAIWETQLGAYLRGANADAGDASESDSDAEPGDGAGVGDKVPKQKLVANGIFLRALDCSLSGAVGRGLAHWKTTCDVGPVNKEEIRYHIDGAVVPGNGFLDSDEELPDGVASQRSCIQTKADKNKA